MKQPSGPIQFSGSITVTSCFDTCSFAFVVRLPPPYSQEFNMPDSHRSPNSDNEKPKPDRKENEKETEMNEMHLDSPPMPHGAPMDVDSSSFIYVSDENDNDSNFGSEYEMAAEVEENLIQLDEDDDTPNTTGTNVPSAPSAPVNPPTQARGPTGTVSSHPLVPPSSIITTPPTQARSSTGTDISRPLTSYTSYGIATVLPQTKGSAPLSPQLSTATRSIPARSRSFMSPDPTGPPPYSAQSLCVVGNSQITSFVFISSLPVNAGLQREIGL